MNMQIEKLKYACGIVNRLFLFFFGLCAIVWGTHWVFLNAPEWLLPPFFLALAYAFFVGIVYATETGSSGYFGD